jgi:hypothetical protein
MTSKQKISGEYREWQYPRVASFLPLILFIPAVWVVAAPFNTNNGMFVGLVFALISAILKIISAKHINISNDSINLGNASIPKKFIGQVTEIPAEDQFAARGSNLDARAFVFLKYGLPQMVKIEINDPKDPTPYVLISTRNASELIAALA